MYTKEEILQTEEAIMMVKETFEKQLMKQLNLRKVLSPIAVLHKSGLNDDLNGIERPVSFPVKYMDEEKAVVVHSLAKWKRLRLKQLGMDAGEGIVTDMKALRPDEDYSPIHSIYVDQWDWEKCIKPEERSVEHLKIAVCKIYKAIKETKQLLHQWYANIPQNLPDDITFIHSEELLRKYPELSPKKRELEITKEFGAVFIIGIGGKLSNGESHDGRAPDYDDWGSLNEEGFYGLNGDILVWHSVLQSAFELSSMGIRVNGESLMVQLKERDCLERSVQPFHQMLIKGDLPQTIGGGIGQSRLCMFLLGKSHIGEVQLGIWPEKEKEAMERTGVQFLG